MRLSKRKFVDLVEEALSDISAQFVQYLRDVPVDVEPVPNPHTCRDADVDDPQSLLGLYRGRPLTSRSVEQDRHLPDRITIYKRNIGGMGSTRAEIIHERRRVGTAHPFDATGR
jgi:predicted Zn-dependent protease with MMP-like domain